MADEGPDETAQPPVRLCDSCGQVDTHPRHVYAVATGDGLTSPEAAAKAIGNTSRVDQAAIIAQIQDSTTIQKHMDCCRTDGCPDGTCVQVTAGAEDLTGDDLVAHLTGEN